MAAFQVRIAYLTPHRRARRYFHQLVLAADQKQAIEEGRAQLAKRSPNTRVIHQVAILRPDSRDAETAVLSGWKYSDGWWGRARRPGDDVVEIARHGYANSRWVSTKTTAGCVAIDGNTNPQS